MSVDNEGLDVPQEVGTDESLRINEDHTKQNANPSTPPKINELQPPPKLLDLSGSSEDVEKSSETSTSASDSDYRSTDSDVEAKKTGAPIAPVILTYSVPETRPTDLKLPLDNVHANTLQNDEAEVCIETPITPKVVLELRDTSSEPSSAPDSPPRSPTPSTEDSRPLLSASEAESTIEREESPAPETLSSITEASSLSFTTPSPSIIDVSSQADGAEPTTPASTSGEDTQISFAPDAPVTTLESTLIVLVEPSDTPSTSDLHPTAATESTTPTDQETAKPVLEDTTSTPETASASELSLTVPGAESSSDPSSIQSPPASTSAEVPTIVTTADPTTSDENRKSGNVAQSSSAPDLRSSSIDRSAANPSDKPASISSPAIARSSRVMSKQEEAEMERVRAERAESRQQGGRRGAFYAPPPPAFRPKLGANHEEVINDPPLAASGAILPMSLSGAKNAKDSKWMRRVSIGWAETTGKRPTMEDAWAAYSQGKDSNALDIFGVFDGHRGDSAAKYAAEHLPSTITSTMRISKNPQDWLRIGFMQTNMAMKQAGIDTGTTVVVGMYWRNTVYLANAGDSRCVHGKVTPGGNIATRMTQDHKPERLDETERIIALGGEVQTNVNKEGKVVGRVNGRLGVSRALGDFDLQPYVIADPEITTIDLTRTPASIAEIPENDGSSSPTAISSATAGSNNANTVSSSSNNASSAPSGNGGASSSNSASPASNSAVNSAVGRSPSGNNAPNGSSQGTGLGPNVSPATTSTTSTPGTGSTSSAPAATPMSAHTPSLTGSSSATTQDRNLQRSTSHNHKIGKDGSASSASSPVSSPANSPFKKRPSSTNTRRHGKSDGSSEIDNFDVSSFDFLVIACDGLWDVVADDEAVNIAAHVLQQGRQPEEAAKRLRNVAYGRGSGDNITVLVIILQPPTTGLKKSSSCMIL